MPTAFTHAAPALALGTVLLTRKIPPAIWLTGVALAVIPDLDVVGFRLNLGYSELLGHRGFSHSLVFAAMASSLAFGAISRIFPEMKSRSLWLYFFLCGASHGALDALTNGGWGVAFFAPLVGTRYFFPVHPILVSPISLEGLLSDWGRTVLWNEVQWVWLPTIFAIMLRALSGRMERVRPALEKLLSQAGAHRQLPTAWFPRLKRILTS